MELKSGRLVDVECVGSGIYALAFRGITDGACSVARDVENVRGFSSCAFTLGIMRVLRLSVLSVACGVYLSGSVPSKACHSDTKRQ